MSSPSPVRLTDDLIARALARPPDESAVADVVDAVAGAIAAHPQRRGGTLHWPALPRLGPAAGGLVVAALLLLLAVALVVVGSRIPRPGPIGIGVNGLVVFDEGGAIRVARSDGTAQDRLTSGTPWTFAPSVSPDGRRVAYWSTPEADLDVHTPRDLEVRELGTAARSATTAVHASGAVAWRIAWSPDSSRLAYADIVDGRRTVFVVGLDGRPARPVSPPALDAWDPVWSPDGSWIGFLGGRVEADRGFYVMRPDGTSAHRVSTVPSRGRGYLIPDWSPISDRVVVAVETSGPDPFQRDIWVLSPDGGTQVDISNDPGDEFAATWSRDATRIAWIRADADDPIRGHVVVAAPDGQAARVVGPDRVDAVAWSPDGRELILKFETGRSDAPVGLEALDLETGAVTVVAAGSMDGNPGWQAAGR